METEWSNTTDTVDATGTLPDSNEVEAVDTASIISDLADAFEDIEDDEQFKSVDELFEHEAAEVSGRWVHWPVLPPGNEVLIAHLSASEKRREDLERAYREKKGIPYGKPLGKTEDRSAVIEAELWIRSLFGGAVKGFRGPQMPKFTLREFLRLFGTADRRQPGLRRFRAFVLREGRRADRAREESAEAATKNLSTV